MIYLYYIIIAQMKKHNFYLEIFIIRKLENFQCNILWIFKNIWEKWVRKKTKKNVLSFSFNISWYDWEKREIKNQLNALIFMPSLVFILSKMYNRPKISFVKEELETRNVQLFKAIDNQVIKKNLPIIDKEVKYQSITDCLDLFFEEENLVAPLFCHKCQGPEDFSKKYSINRLS